MAVEAYCMKCKEKKVMKDPVASTTKNGKPITKGTARKAYSLASALVVSTLFSLKSG